MELSLDALFPGKEQATTGGLILTTWRRELMEAETDQIQRAEAALAAVDFNAVRPAQLLSGFPLAMDSFNHARRPVTGVITMLPVAIALRLRS